MDNLEMRKYVSEMYDGVTWKVRVSCMTETQVFAIFQRVQQLTQERERLNEEWEEFYDALRDPDSSKLDELFKQESLF